MDKEIKNIKIGVQKCESCGGNLEIDLDKKRAICPYCRTEYIIEEEKKGAVESVIGFIERQQKIKQDKKDEELKKKEEERLKWEQESQANKGRNLIISGGVIAVCVILFIILAINENITESKNKKAGKISAPISFEDVKGKNYEDVETSI